MRQEDIAKLARVSRTTVSRVLNGDNTVKKEIREKVLKIVEEVKYERNYISSTLASKKKKNIYAFIVRSIVPYYNEEIKKGLIKFENEFKNFGINLYIIENDINNPEEQLESLKKVLEKNEVAGVIITPLLKEKVLSLILENENVKFITMDSYLSPRIPYVGANYFNSGEISGNIADGILRKYEKALVLKFPDDKVSANRYYQGFINSLEEEQLIISFEKKEIFSKENFLSDKISKDVKVIFTNRFLKEVIENNIDFLRENKDIKIIGIAGNPELNKYLSSGMLFASLNEQYSMISYTSGLLMFNLLYKNIFPDLITLIPANILFKSSIL